MQHISDGFIRLSKTELTTSVVKIEVSLEPTAYKFIVGHSLRVMIASGAHPHISRNPGTGFYLFIYYHYFFLKLILFVKYKSLINN